jgi:hypothetical protein
MFYIFLYFLSIYFTIALVILKETFKTWKPFLKSFLKTKKFKFFLILFLLYKSIFNVFTGTFLLNKAMQSTINGTFSGSFEKFSLFYGFVLENVEILAPESFQNETIFQAKRISLQYNLPAFLLLRFKLTEISLTDPTLHLHQVGGKWNFESLFQPSPPPEPPPEEESGEPLTEINTYLPISAYLHFFLENLKATVHIEDPENPLQASLDGFQISFLLDTHRFSKFPLSPKAAEILEVFQLQMNPTTPPKISYRDKAAELQTDLELKMILDWDSQSLPKKFLSQLRIGKESIPLKYQNIDLPTFGFLISYQLSLEPVEDSLTLSSFLIQFSNQNWLDLSGKIIHLTSLDPNLNLEVKDSQIDFNPLGDLLKKFPGLGDLDIKGKLSLQGIGAKGPISQLVSKLEMHARDIIVIQSSTKHSIPKLDIEIEANLNLIDKGQTTDKDVLPILDNLNFKDFTVDYNGILLTLKGTIDPKTNVDCELLIKNIQLGNFVKTLQGTTEVKVLIGGDRLTHLKLDSSIEIQKLRYLMGKSLSGKNDIQVHFLNTIDLGVGFKLEDLQIDSFTLLLKNELKEIAISLQTKLNLEKKKGLRVQIKDLLFKTNLTKLIPTLPISLRNTIANLRESLGNEISLGGEVDLLSQTLFKQIQITLRASLPGLELKDLLFSGKVKLNADKEESVEIENLHLSGFEKKLKANYRGRFFKPFTANPPFGEYTGALSGNFTLESESYRYLSKGIYFKGDIDFDLDIQGAIIRGAFKSKDSGFKIVEGCPGENCTETEIAGIKMEIPFLHDIHDKTMENLISGNAESFVQNYGLTKPANFSINRITSNHPIQKGAKFDFVKSTDSLPGISAFLEYKENFLVLDNLKISTLDGVIFGKDFIVNVGSGDLSKIQYNAVLQVRDIDLKQILSPTSRQKIKDGKIKADINITGQNLTDPVANVDLFFSIFQIGEDFGRSAVNIVSPTNFVTDRIINSYSVNKIEVEINHGLVYARVLFNPSVMNSLLFQVENDRIQQERIPLANFLKRAQSELSEFE